MDNPWLGQLLASEPPTFRSAQGGADHLACADCGLVGGTAADYRLSDAGVTRCQICLLG